MLGPTGSLGSYSCSSVGTLKRVAREPPCMTEQDLWARSTAPQSPFTIRQVGIGVVVAIMLAIVAFGLPLLLV